MSQDPSAEHFFRHEYGRLVASLVRRFGVSHVAAVEDAAQDALLSALDTWPRVGAPKNPAAWLYRVAHNALLDGLRKQTRHGRLLANAALAPSPNPPAEDPDRDLLRMLFLCCHDALTPELQCAFALKTLVGFSVEEIAVRLIAQPATIHKRLQRARQRLRARADSLDALEADDYERRMPAVHRVLYMIFTEGYLSSDADLAIRAELCDEAIRLTALLARLDHPETAALLALMHLNGARIAGRRDHDDALLLLAEQDRTRWDHEQIHSGLRWLARSAEGDAFSRYHAEAGIAAQHCIAESLETTRWDTIADLYHLWESIEPSPMHRLNRALAVAEGRGPAPALALLADTEFPVWIQDTYQWHAVFADLYRRSGQAARAGHHAAEALARAPSDPIRALLARRFGV
ncbi:MAG: sigma-70 family RNA polymerase sigma factor [Myxococcota bacterium]